jgi:iron complex transport system substrate-binding protein
VSVRHVPGRHRALRPIVVAITAAAVLTACGAGEPTGDAADAAAVSPAAGDASAPPAGEQGDSDVEQAGIREGWAPLLDDLRCDDTAVGKFPRTVVHDGGETTIEAEPQRVVSIEGTTSLDLLLLMGVAPAAAGGDSDGPAVLPWQAYLSGGTPEDPGYPVVVKRPEVSIEQIAAARPDLIISQTGWLQGIEEEIAALGVPVVAFEWGDSGEAPDWRNNVRIVAEAVGRDACADQIVGSVESAIDDTRASLEAAGADQDTWGAFIAMDGYTAYYGADDPIGQTLAGELGLDLVPADGAQTEFSLENASEVLVADRLLATDFYADGGLETFLAEPVVAPAAGRVTALPPDLSGAAYYPSALGLRLFLDHLEETYGA